MAGYHLTGIFLFLSFYFSAAQEIPTPRASAHLFYFNPLQSLLLLDGYSKGNNPFFRPCRNLGMEE